MGKKRAKRRGAAKANQSKTWRKDAFFQKAKRENYVARSVYKLEALNKKYKLIRSGDTVLDLGCHPGSWMQYACKKVGPGGLVLGVDLKPTEPVADNCRTFTEDVFEVTLEMLGVSEEGLDLVMSDMAPNTSGIKTQDQLKSASLVERALHLALRLLKPGGHFVAKIFMGPDEPLIFAGMRDHFERTTRFKPEASRTESSEGYLIGLSRKIPETTSEDQ